MLKHLLEKAYKQENMQWRVYSFDPEKDNELVYTSKAFDCIADAQVDKVEQLKKHPDYIVEISTTVVEESAQVNEAANIDVKNPGILEVPAGKNVEDLPQSHFEKLVDKKGYAEVIRALTNLEVWNKDKNKKLSAWASSMADKLKKKFRPESAEKFTYKYKVGDRVLYEGDKATIKELKTSGTGSLEKLYYSVEKDKEKGKTLHPAREFELKPIKESAQKNEDYKKPKSYDELKAGEWYKFNGEIRQIADRQPIDNEIQMFKVFPDLHVGNGTHAAYKSLFKPTDFVYVDKRELINKAIKERESQIAKLKLEIDALKKSL